MPRITGLGGVFLNVSGDSKRLLDWYHKVLGLEVTEYGINLMSPHIFTLITFDSKKHGQTVLNFTVDNLEDFIEILKTKDVKIVQEVKVVEFGKFAQIEDIQGNLVELCELDHDRFKQLVEKEINEYKMNVK